MLKNKLGLLVFVLVVSSFSCIGKASQGDKVCVQGTCVDVEVVQSRADRERGLQHRESLDPNAGMLFIFPRSGKHSFWMKNTLIALDMIWINHYQEIVYIQENATPCKMHPCTIYTPTKEALYVLEVNAGYVQENDLQIGDRVDFKVKFNQK